MSASAGRIYNETGGGVIHRGPKDSGDGDHGNLRHGKGTGAAGGRFPPDDGARDSDSSENLHDSRGGKSSRK